MRVCGDCWSVIRPTEYEPETFIAGDCDVCGQSAFVHRVSKAEVEQAKAHIATSLDWFVREQRIQAALRVNAVSK